MTPLACGPCGAVHRKRSVVSTRSAPCVLVIQPRSMPTGYVARPKPTAATLEKDGDGQRSGIRPLDGFARSQKKRKLRSCNVSANARSAAGIGCVMGFPHATANSTNRMYPRMSPRRIENMRIWEYGNMRVFEPDAALIFSYPHIHIFAN